jgi:spermidine/putrescine-binding protein
MSKRKTCFPDSKMQKTSFKPIKPVKNKNDVLYLSLNISKKSADNFNMDDLKKTMIKKAKDRFKKIHPCGLRRKLDECFTVEDDRLCFWFNTEDESTHVLHTRM